MKEIYRNKQPNTSSDVIDLKELFYVLFIEKWMIVSVTAFVSIIGVVYSLYLPNIYESRALLTPSKSSGSISSVMQSYSGIAGIAGVSLPVAGDDNNSKNAIAKISSLSFFEREILPNIFIPNLMAMKSWSLSTNSISYDERVYDKDTNTWIKNSSNSQKQIPTAQDSFRAFTSSHLSIREDNKTGFVTISIKHQSPFVAKKWIELLVNKINSFYREKDKIESEKAISFLNQKIATTSLSEVKQTIAELLQKETQKLALVEANEFYVFEYIDSPAVMEMKSEPRRALICILFTALGGMLSILIVLIRHYLFNEKSA